MRRAPGLQHDGAGALVRPRPSTLRRADRQPELGLDGAVGRVVHGDVDGDERGTVGLVAPVAEPVRRDADLAEDLHVVDVDGRARDQFDVVPDAPGVAVGPERCLRPRAVHRVDHVTLDLGDRHGPGACGTASRAGSPRRRPGRTRCRRAGRRLSRRRRWSPSWSTWSVTSNSNGLNMPSWGRGTSHSATRRRGSPPRRTAGTAVAHGTRAAPGTPCGTRSCRRSRPPR